MCAARLKCDRNFNKNWQSIFWKSVFISINLNRTLKSLIDPLRFVSQQVAVTWCQDAWRPTRRVAFRAHWWWEGYGGVCGSVRFSFTHPSISPGTNCGGRTWGMWTVSVRHCLHVFVLLLFYHGEWSVVWCYWGLHIGRSMNLRLHSTSLFMVFRKWKIGLQKDTAPMEMYLKEHMLT